MLAMVDLMLKFLMERNTDVREMIFVIPNHLNVPPFTVLPIAYPKQDIIFARQEGMLKAVRWVPEAVLGVQNTRRVHLFVAHVVIGKEGTHYVPMEKIRMGVVWGIIVHSHVVRTKNWDLCKMHAASSLSFLEEKS